MACELLQREIPTAEGTLALVGVRQLAASKALDLHVELIGTVDTALFPFIKGEWNFGDVIQTMRYGGEKLSALIKKVVCMATIDGEPITPALFDIKYGNDLMLVYKVFAFVVEANFLDFFNAGLEINEQRRSEEAAKLALAEQQNSSPGQTSV